MKTDEFVKEHNSKVLYDATHTLDGFTKKGQSAALLVMLLITGSVKLCSWHN